eukprot:c14111_g1_i1 orf=568-1869(+)
MAPQFDDDDNGQGYASSKSKKIIYDDDERGYGSSQSRQEESCQDSYDSDCSVTSRVDGHLQEGTIAPCMNWQAADLTILQADGSLDTTWTDDKHSSYLDSMEATFVQKMYDKEYCSLDVCGHSYHSSVMLEQECVESQPFCLNMRKPFEQKLGGLLTLQAPARTLPFVPSMLASPWIQHFKSQKKVSLKNAEVEDEAAQTQGLDVSASTKEVLKTASVTSDYSSLNEVSSKSSPDLAHKKRGALISFSDCKYAATNLRGYTRTSHSHIAAEYKKYKCQHSALSHMDILMEEQYNSEQQSDLGPDIGMDDGKEESEKHMANHCEHKVASVDSGVVKEKQELAMGTNKGPLSILASGASLRKLDQVVPSFQTMEGEEACEKSILPDMHGDEEDADCTDLTEPENAAPLSGSKTWTWGIQGPRYHRIKKKDTHYRK